LRDHGKAEKHGRGRAVEWKTHLATLDFVARARKPEAISVRTLAKSAPGLKQKSRRRSRE